MTSWYDFYKWIFWSHIVCLYICTVCLNSLTDSFSCPWSSWCLHWSTMLQNPLGRSTCSFFLTSTAEHFLLKTWAFQSCRNTIVWWNFLSFHIGFLSFFSRPNYELSEGQPHLFCYSTYFHWFHLALWFPTLIVPEKAGRVPYIQNHSLENLKYFCLTATFNTVLQS